MQLNTWLEAEPGRAKALAAHFAVSKSAVSQWKSNGVPTGFMLAVRDFTEGAVTLDEMLSGRERRPTAVDQTAA